MTKRRQRIADLRVKRGREWDDAHGDAEEAEGAEEVLLGAVDELALGVVAHVGDGDDRLDQAAVDGRRGHHGE